MELSPLYCPSIPVVSGVFPSAAYPITDAGLDSPEVLEMRSPESAFQECKLILVWHNEESCLSSQGTMSITTNPRIGPNPCMKLRRMRLVEIEKKH